MGSSSGAGCWVTSETLFSVVVKKKIITVYIFKPEDAP